MKTRKSVTAIPSLGETEVTMMELSVEDYTKAVGKGKVERMLNDNVNRHHFLTALRKAGAVVNGDMEFKSDVTKARAVAEAKALLARVKGGEVFNPIEFLPKDEFMELAVKLHEAVKTGAKTLTEVEGRFEKLDMIFDIEDLSNSSDYLRERARRIEAAKKAAEAELD